MATAVAAEALVRFVTVGEELSSTITLRDITLGDITLGKMAVLPYAG